MRVVHTVRNYELLREGRVVAVADGFYTVLKDLETGDDYPSMWRYASLTEAMAEAEFLAKYDV